MACINYQREFTSHQIVNSPLFILFSPEIIMDLMVIEVHEIPHIAPDDRMVDQLKIHFLKRQNNGGDVLTVMYPTSAPGQAYVIFESAEGTGDEHTLGYLQSF